jgi:glycosyltransferase involved in cell wall biosynthesis
MTHQRPKFVLIEQSLREVGGHFLEYAREILGAASAAGYQPVLAAHREFRGTGELPRDWKIYSLFPYGSDRIHRIPSAYSFGLWRQIIASGGNLPAIAARMADAVADRCKAAVSGLRWWRRYSRIRGFAAACARLFAECPLAGGDQVLCSTMSDMDLLGLVRFLHDHPETAALDWHLQFHFSVYCGRDPDYPVQDRRVRSLKRRLADALASIPRHRLHFYSTTDELGRQFNRLNVARFQTLPWPVGEQFFGDPTPPARLRGATAPARQPLRVLCAGAVRREKGSDQLGALAKSLWNDLLQPGKVQLLFQLGHKRRWQKLTELTGGSFAPAASIDELPNASLVSLPHPLQPTDYARLIKSADIGLLLYNADVYFARCSGILAELLAAGVPVIVPAGGWLAEQIAEENYGYLDQLSAAASATQPLSGLSATIPVPPGTRDAVVRLWRAAGDQPGSYIRIEAEQLGGAGRPLGRFGAIVGQRREEGSAARPVSALFHLQPGCDALRVNLAGAYRQPLPTLQQSSVVFLPPPATAVGHWPAGKVGLSLTDIADVPALLADIADHHAHYRAGALAFAARWAVDHAADRTIEQLTGRLRATKQPSAHAA